MTAHQMFHGSQIGHFMESELLGCNHDVSQDLSPSSVFTDFNTSSCYLPFTRPLNSLKLTFLKSNTPVSQNQMIQFSFWQTTYEALPIAKFNKKFQYSLATLVKKKKWKKKNQFYLDFSIRQIIANSLISTLSFYYIRE